MDHCSDRHLRRDFIQRGRRVSESTFADLQPDLRLPEGPDQPARADSGDADAGAAVQD